MELLRRIFKKRNSIQHPDLAKAMRIVCDELRRDQSEGSYYYAWQSNIAVSFYNEMKTYSERNHLNLYMDLHTVSNNAAKRFLNLLIR